MRIWKTPEVRELLKAAQCKLALTREKAPPAMQGRIDLAERLFERCLGDLASYYDERGLANTVLCAISGNEEWEASREGEESSAEAIIIRLGTLLEA